MLNLPVDELIRWNDVTHTRWMNLLNQHPELLDLSTDIRSSERVNRVLQHIVAVELRYAERLASQPETDYSAIPCTTTNEIFATHTQAMTLILPLIADDSYPWTEPLEFQTITMGRLRSTRRDILIHMLMHGIRHYAQLATLVRQAGVDPGWPMDFLMLNAQRA